MTQKKECACQSCQGACHYKPGWFKPGEAEKAAELLKMSLSEFFNSYLGVDWLTSLEGPTFLLSPATIEMKAGTEYPGDPRGQCVFFKEGRCSIHEAKPFECAQYQHDDSYKMTSRRHYEVADLWKDDAHQKQIVDLLGRAPIESDYY